MPNYGPQGRSTETVAEWLLGDRKWRVLAELARRPGRAFRVDELAERAGCAEPTVYELLRALRPTQAIRQDGGVYALDPDNDLADALILLTRALRGHRRRPVDRPTRRR
jgi:DNA-binding IclR family transcriptional regulator